MNHKTLKLTKSGYKYHEKAHASPLAILRAVSIRIIAAYLFLFGTVQAQTLDVFAAASLNEVFMDLGKAFEAERPGMSVRLNSAGSAVLATQLVQGAAADVFASADLETLLRIVSEGEARAFASTSLTLIVAAQSSLQTIEDLSTEDYLLVLAAENVPVGRYARQVLDELNEVHGPDFSAAVLARLVSNEASVRQAATKVMLGEADATFVYSTDLASLDLEAVRELGLTQSLEPEQLRASYYIAVTPNAAQPELAAAFLDFVLGEGQGILQEYGFGGP